VLSRVEWQKDVSVIGVSTVHLQPPVVEASALTDVEEMELIAVFVHLLTLRAFRGKEDSHFCYYEPTHHASNM
jgi:hypothetical protein